MIDVTVLTIAYKPGYIDTMAQALKDQTLDHDRWEWILVDDICDKRREAVRELVGSNMHFLHIPPREIKPYSATGIAVNTGLAQARGKLVYFMADYMYPHPSCLERHWQIYQEFGPKVFISGPIIDAITQAGRSLFAVDPAKASKQWEQTILIGDELSIAMEGLPSLTVGLKEGFNLLTEDNALSIWAQPFTAQWPAAPGVDWRMGYVSLEARGLAPDLLKHYGAPTWWWAGRNDSADLKLLLESGGLDEGPPGKHGGLEVIWQQRMKDMGASYLIDQRAPAMLLPHPTRKREFV